MSAVVPSTGFEGRTVAVVGASGGIGQACVQELAALGAAAVLCGRDTQKLSARAPGRSAVLAVDLEKPETFAAAAQQLPLLDGLVFAAGVALVRPFTLTDAAALRRVLAVNVEGPLLLLREIMRARRLSAGSAVVFIGSIAAHRGAPGYTAYSASKGALVSAVRGLALEAAGAGIRVNVISPGLVQTAMADDLAGQMTAEQAKAYAASYPLGLGRPEDVARGATFLLSSAARWMTGADLVMDGGATLR
jgi:NAD(P)-dependent dehydrogenase (short-subunit alcohol dehydrogenase family)